MSCNGGNVAIQAPPLDSGHTSDSAIRPAPVAAPLHGSVDVLLWDIKDPSRHGASIRDASARPIRHSDKVRLNMTVNRPGYVYLVWIDGQGKAFPVYPWRPGDWRNRPEREQPIEHLSLPADAAQGWPMGGVRGMETILLLARDTPLPSGVDLENAVAGLQPQSLQNPDALVEFETGRPISESMDHSRAPQFFDAQRIDDPLLQNQQLIQERLERHFSWISAVSFANRGE